MLSWKKIIGKGIEIRTTFFKRSFDFVISLTFIVLTNLHLGKTYIFHDTISEILLYKSLMGKIDIEKLLADNEMLAKKKLLSQAFKGLYLTIFTDDEEIERRFENEELEDNDLESR